ncbi:MAG: Stk1 family PASTA domain-containing Ser/Thr kinase [Microbacteriaceae bacterium]|nr:Stk1 family PASTA domain-containing Ser/Thr kinase [Microbacteriaceae bacterium]
MSDDVVQSVRTLAGRYEVREAIGHGGMADVHVGTDTRLGRQVAIKLLHPELADDPAFRARFRREAHDAAKMAHPTVVRVFDAGEEAVPGADGTEHFQPFIVMEYVDGRLLRDIIADGPLPQEQAAKIVEQVLVALEYSHRAGVIHRDVKPGNIMVTRTGQVKVMDFGIARAVSDSASTLAETASIVGTAQYFSPEQAKGAPLDARTDLYSTGVVLFELLTGRPPFEGDNPVAVAYQHVNAEPPMPSRLNPDVSPALDLVVAKALAKDPARRYQSAQEFRTDLETAAGGQLPIKRSVKPDDFNVALFGSSAAAQAAQTARQLSADADGRSLRTQTGPPVVWLWAGIIAILAIVAAVAYWILTIQPANLTENLTVKVPDSVYGKTFEAGRADLEDLGLSVERVDETNDTVAAGTIIGTDPVPGTSVERGFTITVTVSSGPRQIQIPDVALLGQDAAVKALQDAGFVVGAVNQVGSGSVPAGQVISTEPAARTQAPRGSTVNLNLSNGMVHVPSVVGQPTAQGVAALQAALGTGAVQSTIDTTCTGGTVQTQSIPEGDYPQGTLVTVSVCLP